MNILILGANGMLGFTLFKYLNSKKKLEVFGTVREKKIKKKNIFSNVDVSDFKYLKKKISSISPEIIINCVGIVKSEVSSISSKKVMKINSKLPIFLNSISNDLKFRLIHVSTDCVFSGKNKKNTEKSKAHPNDLYGKSKLLGEFKSMNNLVIRTSIIGHEIKHKRGLLEWFLKQEKAINGFSNAYFSGLTTLELSKIFYKYILFNQKVFGLCHISGKRISKYNLLKKIKKIYNRKILIKKEVKFNIDRTLDCSYFKKKTGYKKKNWNKMIRENKNYFLKYAD